MTQHHTTHHATNPPAGHLPTPDLTLPDEAADAPWCGSHWADLSTFAVATTARHEPADLLARRGTAGVPAAPEEGAFRPAA